MKIYDMITFHGTEGLRSVRPRQISGGGEGYSEDSEKREKNWGPIYLTNH